MEWWIYVLIFAVPVILIGLGVYFILKAKKEIKNIKNKKL
jgi:hypothetical protein